MSRQQPPPSELGRVFTTRQARVAGMSPDRLRRYSSPTRGVRTTAPAESVVEHLEAFVPVLPRGCAFSHVTAARVLGLWLPTAWSAQEPVHIVLPDGLVRPRRRGVISHPVCTPRETTVTRGLRVTTAAETWVDLAAALDVDALVVLGWSFVWERDVCIYGVIRLMIIHNQLTFFLFYYLVQHFSSSQCQKEKCQVYSDKSPKTPRRCI